MVRLPSVNSPPRFLPYRNACGFEKAMMHLPASMQVATDILGPGKQGPSRDYQKENMENTDET
jgi:hypothetical protein